MKDLWRNTMIRKISKEEKQKRYLDRILKKSFSTQKRFKNQMERETFENQMKWNSENLRPNGGRKPFNITTNDKKDN